MDLFGPIRRALGSPEPRPRPRDLDEDRPAPPWHDAMQEHYEERGDYAPRGRQENLDALADPLGPALRDVYDERRRENFQPPARRRVSVETPIEPFVAPELSDKIPAAYRSLAEQVVVAVTTFILQAEKARQAGVAFLEECDRQGAWHNEFMATYVNHETKRVLAMQEGWQRALDELAARREQFTPKPKTTEPEEKTP